jgi:hypothetical protein
MGQLWLDGYSAEVEIYLLIDGKRLDVAQIARDALVLRDEHPIPPGTAATLVTRIDGHEEREEIFLRAGAENNEQLVPFF